MPEIKLPGQEEIKQKQYALNTFLKNIDHIKKESKRISDSPFTSTTGQVDALIGLVDAESALARVLFNDKVFNRKTYKDYWRLLFSASHDLSNLKADIEAKTILDKPKNFWAEKLFIPLFKKADKLLIALGNKTLKDYRVFSDLIDANNTLIAKSKKISPPKKNLENYLKFRKDLKELEDHNFKMQVIRAQITTQLKELANLDIEALSKSQITGLSIPPLVIPAAAMITLIIVAGVVLITVIGGVLYFLMWNKRQSVKQYNKQQESEEEVGEKRKKERHAPIKTRLQKLLDEKNRRLKGKSKVEGMSGLGKLPEEMSDEELDAEIAKAEAKIDQITVEENESTDDRKGDIPYPFKLTWEKVALYGVGIATVGYAVAKIVPAVLKKK